LFIIGWFIFGATYLLLLFGSLAFGSYFFEQNENVRTLTIVLLSTVPYIIIGYYVRKIYYYDEVIKGVLLSAGLPMFIERTLIFIIGIRYSLRDLRDWDISLVIPYISKLSPAYYFTYGYLLMGLFSILITILVAKKFRLSN
jgi:hypothetical protein